VRQTSAGANVPNLPPADSAAARTLRAVKFQPHSLGIRRTAAAD